MYVDRVAICQDMRVVKENHQSQRARSGSLLPDMCQLLYEDSLRTSTKGGGKNDTCVLAGWRKSFAKTVL